MRVDYRDPRDEALPHIVRFSGGRSSAAMTFLLAEAGVLRPERGDVVLFANTSAEHPGTYAFAAKCKRRVERDYGIPFFWYEFCTVEDAWRGSYRRKLSYRLVDAVPVERDERRGYRSRGEVFEELLSFQGMLPTPMSRSCTSKLKLYPQHLLLAEWLGSGDGPEHDGHHADRPLLTAEAAVRLYRKNRGSASEESYRERIACMIGRPPARPAQLWDDYTAAPSRNWAARDWARGRPRFVELWGRDPARFVTLLGLRADEPNRVRRVMSRSFYAENAPRRQCSVRTQPPGERPYFPLFDAGYGAREVREHWNGQDFDLACPTHAGNCVFCFMKGTEPLARAAQAEDPQRVQDHPSDIRWWAAMEQKYRREAPKRNGEGIARFGFLGVSGPSYEQLAAGNPGRRSRFSGGTPACDCTD